MSRLGLALLLLASLAMRPGAALAKAEALSPDDARRVVLDYATCIVKSKHEQAAKSLIVNADSAGIRRDFSRLIDGHCLRPNVDSIEFTADLFRYALADALVAAEFADGGPGDFSDRRPLVHITGPSPADVETALAKAKPGKERDRVLSIYKAAQAAPVLSRYGECVVRHNPTGARLWALTKPGTPEEMSVINALRPSFAHCLKDGTVAFSKATMRGTVALNYYRLAHAL